MPGASGPLVLPQAAALQLRFYLRQQVIDRQPLQILRVEPFQLGPVENAVGAADSSERKSLDQIPGAQEFLVTTGRPSQQRQKIAKRLGKKTLGAVHIHIGGAVAFG